MATTSFVLLTALVCLFASQASARILTECEAAKELARAGVSRTYISNYVCIMKNDGDFNTKKKTGPGAKASYSYGIFQISSESNKYCSAFRPAGLCNKNCNDFLNDDIQDDIACARLIAEREGFKHWKGWVKKCKNGQLPNINGCIIRRDISDEEMMERIVPRKIDSEEGEEGEEEEEEFYEEEEE